MTRTPGAMDARRLASAIDRLDAVSASDREAAAKHVFDVCVYHVTRVRKAHPSPPHHRGHGRISGAALAPTPVVVFDVVHPHVDRIARRLDRAMRHAETSPHPADAAALIVAVDAQGALAALFAVAQNAGVHPAQLEALASPLRKRSAPALLRTLFSPDMRVANAAKKALRQVAAIASCQSTSWMTSIRAGLELRAAPRADRSTLLRNLLSRLSEILHLVVRQAAASRVMAPTGVTRRRSSKSSFGALAARPRRSLSSERRAAAKSVLRSERRFFRPFRSKRWRALFRHSSAFTDASDISSRSTKRRFRTDSSYSRRLRARRDSTDEMHSVGSGGAHSASSSYPGSLFSSVTESGGASVSRPLPSAPARKGTTIKRDAATAMHIFERLLSKRINPDLDDRLEIISTLADIAQATFSGHYATTHKIEHVREYSNTMASVFQKYGQKIYTVVLDVLFRPVREADANRIGVFSFHETGIIDFGNEAPFTRRKLAEFPQSAICLPNMDCTSLAAVTCNSLLKVFLRFVPEVCAQRMALLTGTINSAFLHASEALQKSSSGCAWERSKLVSAVDALAVLVVVIPSSVESALELVISEPVTLRLVIETCIRSVSATGRLLAQNAARKSAPILSDEGTLDSLRSWQALIRIVPSTSSWAGTPSYSSSILFLAQVARRAALISVLQGYRKNRYTSRAVEDSLGDDAYPSISTTSGTASTVPPSIGIDDRNGNEPPSFIVNGVGFEAEDENLVTAELQKCIIMMTSVAGANPADVYFELYRTIVYLYASELKKMHLPTQRKAAASAVFKSNDHEGNTYAEQDQASTTHPQGSKANKMLKARSNETRTQSDEDVRGVLVENIAVDGELPSRALRRAVMASELDLGEYFDVGQPLSLQHVGSSHMGLPAGMHTFEEFSYALAIILGTLSHKQVMENMEDAQEVEQLISRDVRRSGSTYLMRVHQRARAILQHEILNQDYDWRAAQYEERIRRLEEEVASLKSMVQHSIEESVHMFRRKSLPKILGRSHESPAHRQLYGDEGGHASLCGPSRCFCSN